MTGRVRFRLSGRAGVVRRLPAVAAIVMAAAIIEIFVCNFRYFLPRLFHAPQENFLPSSLIDLKNARLNGDTLELTARNASVTLPDVNAPVYSLRILTQGVAHSLTVTAAYTDDNFENQYLDAGQWVILPGVRGADTLHFIADGNCHTIQLNFSTQNTQNISIVGLAINREHFLFRRGRFLALALMGLLLYLLHATRPWRIPWDESSRRHRAAFAAVALLSVAYALTIFFTSASRGALRFRTSVPPTTNDSYQQLTNAFYHGQLSFTTEPPASLQALPNPYDASARSQRYLWDNIYYKGKYYSYFGIAPVLTLLLPFRQLTGYFMPTAVAVLIFTLGADICLLGLYLSLIRLSRRPISLLAFLGGEAAVGFSNLFWAVARPYFYELAEMAGLAFLLAGLWLMAAALPAERKPRPAGGRATTARLLGAGLCLGLSVASRPTFLFYLPAALPLLWPHLRGPGIRVGRGVARLAAVGAPLGAVGILVAGYNYLRFGSPLDFGIHYQITVSDIQYNKLSDFVQVINGLYHYYLQPLSFDLYFPFFHVVSKIPSAAAQYSFNYPAAGIFNFPVMIVLLACVPVLRRRMPPRSPVKRLTALLLVTSLLVSYMDITLGGIQMRYTMDIYFTLLLAAILLWTQAVSYCEEKGMAEAAGKIYAVICGASAVISSLICFVGEESFVSRHNPAIYQSVLRAFEFWR